LSLADYQRRFRSLNVNVSGGRRSPHKICMLLAVLDLARSGSLTVNEVRYDPALLVRYNRYFSAVQAPGDHPNAYFPFFHLGGRLRGGEASFWHLVSLPGEEVALTRMTTARSHGDITHVVAYARLDDELFSLRQDPASVEILAETLAAHWFDRGLEDLAAVAADERRVSLYERRLRLAEAPGEGEDPGEAVRSPAFRRVVIQAYDYRCAASGVRVLLPDGTAMVEAAHIHAFSACADDDPRNGLALTPDMHWAMDNGLIAPGPDYRWHIHRALDDRVPDFAHLVRLKGRELILPKEARFYPKREALEWRLERMRNAM
jgi:putative restriction endonuclease